MDQCSLPLKLGSGPALVLAVYEPDLKKLVAPNSCLLGHSVLKPHHAVRTPKYLWKDPHEEELKLPCHSTG